MIKLGIVMDPIRSINIKKDTSFAMLLEAQKRGYEIHYMELHDLFLRNGIACAQTYILNVKENYNEWFSFGNVQEIQLHELNIILMRKDPPFNTEFIYATYILEHAEKLGTLVVNRPCSLRDCNEKIYATCFPKLIPDSLVTSNKNRLKSFWQKHGDIIIKPLDSMGGTSVFRIQADDPNVSVIIEVMTNNGSSYCMAQNYLPAIKDGDKRLLIIDGQPVPYCLARIPLLKETRANLAAGGHGEVRVITKSDLNIALQLAPILKEKGLIFVGLDIIGDKVTEINITSPTGVREIEAAYPISITSMLMNCLEKRIHSF
ncbi:glutathione synthase [Candidatus Ishikawella capsulata]|uniref:Glutathione synthetase n=1 Tax=Candidatus Ishikawaella capsulata Mpkobe TaxID=476281 RepID=C5WDJ5_9ENTR|nr:glutathione synthase [Candidatus Ishikawaella capsulata]BAH83401.1 glutathione synthetase [Candidatus Ishikawaella capsulata Mpkobe]